MAINNARIRFLRGSTKVNIDDISVYAGQPYFLKGKIVTTTSNGDEDVVVDVDKSSNIDGTLFISQSDGVKIKDLKGINVATVSHGLYRKNDGTYISTDNLIDDVTHVKLAREAEQVKHYLRLQTSDATYDWNGLDNKDLSDYYVDRFKKQDSIAGEKTFKSNVTLSGDVNTIKDAVFKKESDKMVLTGLRSIYTPNQTIQLNKILNIGDTHIWPETNNSIDIGNIDDGDFYFKNLYLKGEIRSDSDSAKDITDITDAVHAQEPTAISLNKVENSSNQEVETDKLITNNAVYYALPQINNKKDYTSESTFYAPTKQIFTSTSKAYLVAATSTTSLNNVTSNSSVYTSGGKLYSNGKEVVTLSDTQTLTSKTLTTPIIASIKNGSAAVNIPTTSGTLALRSGVTANTAALQFLKYNADGIVTGNLKTVYNKKITINKTSRNIITDSNSDLTTIFAPTTGGTAGSLLVSTGDGEPVWTTSSIWDNDANLVNATAVRVQVTPTTDSLELNVLLSNDGTDSNNVSLKDNVLYGNNSTVAKRLRFNPSTGTLTTTTFKGALSGNASTATILQASRAINGTSFNGSASITTYKWGTARNISITDGTNTSTAVSVDGSKSITLNLPSTIKATLTGTATNVSNSLTFQDSATATATFNGSAAKTLVGKVVDMFTPQAIGGLKTFSVAPKTSATLASNLNDTTLATTNWVRTTGNGVIHSNADEDITGVKTFKAGLKINNNGSNTWTITVNSSGSLVFTSPDGNKITFKKSGEVEAKTLNLV